MAGRDLSAELFSTPAPSSAGRDLSAELFAEPSATDEVANVGKRGLLQAERTRADLKFQSGAITAKEYAESISDLARRQKQIKPSGNVAAGLERLQEANETGSFGDVAKEVIKPKNWKALASLVAESAVATLQTVPVIVGAGIAAGPPGLAVASGATSFATEFGSAIGELLDKRKVDTSNVAAVQKLLEDPKFISEAREYGVKRGIPVAAFDALSAGFAGRFIRALKTAGTGVTRKAAITAGAKEAGVQVGSGMAGEAGGQILTGENKPLDIIVEGLADLPGGLAEVATGARNRGAKGKDLSSELFGKETKTTTKTAKGKDLSSELFEKKETAPPPPPATQTTATTPEQVRAERIAALTELNIQQGIPAENAEGIATRKVDAELKAEAKAASIKIPEGRVEQITQDLIAAGVPPQQAVIDAQRLAQEEAQSDELAQDETRRTADIAEPVSTPSGESVSVAGQPSAEPPAAGAGVVEPSGVVPTGQDVAGAPAGETSEQAPLDNLTAAFSSTGNAIVDNMYQGMFDAYKKGSTKFAGNEDPILIAAKEDGKTFASPKEIQDYANEPGVKERATEIAQGIRVKRLLATGKTPEEIQAQLPNVDVSKYVQAPPAETKPSPYALTRGAVTPDTIRALSDEQLDTELTNTSLSDAEYDLVKTEITQRQEGNVSGPETSETIETTQEGQEAPPAGAVTKGKRGRPPAPKRHVVVKNSDNKFDHVDNGDVVATYDNNKQATAAVNLAKAKDKGDTALIAKNQEKLDKALASTGRGRPAKVVSEDGAVDLDRETKVELNALESALETYNSPAGKDSVANAAMYISEVAADKTAPEAVRNRAKQMLEDDVDPKDIPKKLRSAAGRVDKPDTGFNNLTTGSQAIAQIIKTGNLFQRFVAQRIRNFMVGVKFVVVEKGDATPANILEELKEARGLFVYTPGQKERTVYVRGSSFGDLQGINNITVLHELLHAATASRIQAGLLKGFRNASLQKFIREMGDIMKRAEQEYKDLAYLDMVDEDVNDIVSRTYDPKTDSYDIFKNPYEFLAYGMSSPEFQKFLMRVKGVRKEPTLFSTFVNSIRDLFGIKQSDATAFSDLVDITDKMLGTRLTAIQMGRTSLQQKGKFTPPEFNEEADSKAQRSALQLARDVKIAKEKVRLSNEGDAAKNVELMQLARDPKAVRNILANVTSDLGYTRLEATVRLPTFDFLAKWAADKGIPALNKANTQLQRMLGMSQQFLVGAERVIDSLNRGFKEDPKLSRKQFADFVYGTTLAEVDPSDTNTRIRSKQLDADYKALGSVGQRMYKQLRDYYESIIELYSDILDEQIGNMQGMSPEEKKNLMAVLRKTFEAESRIRPFFPLVRRGDFFLAIGSGDARQFYLFETRAERNEAAKQMAAERGKSLAELIADKEFVQGNDLKELRAASQDASTMLKEVFAAIDAKDMGSPEAKEGLKDAVYQIYLTTMPEQSFRRQFTHRKGRAGFSTDLQRNIATTASKQSIQLARLKYAPQLRLALSEARDSIGEREELSPFVQEAEKRVNMALSGAHGSLSESVAGIANKASYFWYLSSAASALIQPSSVFISGLPVLAGNYNNATGAATELAKMTTLVNQYSVFRPNPDGTTSISAPSIANNKSLPADERKAIGEMTSRGVSESTYASLVWGYKSMSTEQFEGVVGKGKRLADLMVGALMHNTERLSREAVYLAAYRLGKKQGLDYDAAVQKAVDSTNEALGNYDVTNRPRFMQQGIGKIAFQFKTYPLQMSLLLLTNFKNMLPYLNKEGKKEAATKFFGMMGTSFLLAGAANMALIKPIMGLAGWAWSQLELDDDWPEELKGIDFFTWFFEVLLPEKLGDVTLGGVPVSDLIKEGPFNALTGLAIGSRIGLADLWGRDSKETKTSRESAIAFMLDHFGGPTASLLLGFADAYDAYALGDYQKMLDRMLPAVARNLVVANRYADEGMKTGRGVELVGKDDVKTGELIGQAIGFRPDILASTQGPAFKLSGIEQKINNQRNLLLNKLDFQRRKDTDEGDEKFDDIIDNEVAKFNDKYPSYRLTRATINESLKKRADQRATSRAGVNVTKQNKPIIEEATDTLENRLDRRAEEMAAKRRAEKNPQ
jgi:hypothetical protein